MPRSVPVVIAVIRSRACVPNISPLGGSHPPPSFPQTHECTRAQARTRAQTHTHTHCLSRTHILSVSICLSTSLSFSLARARARALSLFVPLFHTPVQENRIVGHFQHRFRELCCFDLRSIDSWVMSERGQE